MYEIAACDDDEFILNILSDYITEFCSNYNCPFKLSLYHNGEALLEQNAGFDLIFLDIQMSPLTGIELAKMIRTNNTHSKIVFVTNYTDYTHCAFDVKAFDYLSKPVNKNKLFRTLNDALNRYSDKKTICLNTEDGTISLDVNNILYMEYVPRKIRIKTDTDILYSSNSLIYFYKSLNIYNFEYSHKGYIVNLKRIRKIEGFKITLDNEEIIPLAQKKAPSFKKIYFDYLHNEFGKII